MICIVVVGLGPDVCSCRCDVENLTGLPVEQKICSTFIWPQHGYEHSKKGEMMCGLSLRGKPLDAW